MNKMKTELYKSFADAADAAVNAIKKRKVDLRVRHILLVPDKYTLDFEQKVYGGCGAFDVEVLTLSRLQQRVAPLDALSREGAVMLVKRAVEAVSTKLKYFKQASEYGGFARRMYDTISQLKSAAISPDDLKSVTHSVSALKLKFDDVALIYETYNSIAPKLTDAAGRLVALCAAASKSDYIANSHFYVTGFADPTKLILQAFDSLSKSAKSFTVFDVDALPHGLGSGELYIAPDYVTEVKSAAKRILSYVYQGGRFGDCAVISPDITTAERILNEYGIMHNADVKVKLSTRPLARLIKLACVMRSGAYTRANMIELSKNFYSGISPDDSERFELYAIERAIDFTGFTFTFEDECAERARVRLIELCECMRLNGSFTECARALLDKVDAEKNSESEELLSFCGAKEYGKIMQLLRLCDSLAFGDYIYQSEAFFDAAHSVLLSVLPVKTDCVLLCSPDALRVRRVKQLFVTGCNEGDLPITTTDTALINDFDFAESGLNSVTSVEEINRRARRDLEFVIASAQHTFMSASSRPAPFFTQAKQSGNYSIVTYEAERAKLDMSLDLNEIGDYVPCVAAAREALAAGQLQRSASSLFQALKQNAKTNAKADFSNYHQIDLSAVNDQSVDKSAYSERVFRNNKISVTQIQTYFRCPYKHFLKYGLRLKERKVGGVRALETGTIIHSVLEQFVKDPKLDNSHEAALKYVDNALASLKGLYGLTEAVKRRLVSEALEFMSRVKTQIESGEYQVVCAERKFGEEKNPPNALKVYHSPDIYLMGVIDRIDTFSNYARIVDYKVGSKKFDVADVYTGLALQLPLYSYVVRETLNKEVAGFFYVRLQYKFLADSSPLMLSGLCTRDKDAICAMDKSLLGAYSSGKVTSEIIPVRAEVNKEGSFAIKGSGSWESLDDIIDYSVNVVSQAISEILDGYRAPSPLTEDPCMYCEAKLACYSRNARSAVSVNAESFAKDLQNGEELE